MPGVFQPGFKSHQPELIFSAQNPAQKKSHNGVKCLLQSNAAHVKLHMGPRNPHK